MAHIFHLAEGIEVCGRDEENSFDNLIVHGTPRYDDRGRLLIDKKEDNGNGIISLAINPNQLAYEVTGHGKEFEAVLKDIQKRDDTLEYGDPEPTSDDPDESSE